MEEMVNADKTLVGDSEGTTWRLDGRIVLKLIFQK
jgi:hypothetical protein